MIKKPNKIKDKNLKLTTLAFTLVELLAVIVILAVILVIAIPQIISVIKAARLSSIKDSAMLIAEQAEKDFLAQQVLNQDYNETSIPCSDVSKLNDDYASCKITYNNGVATVTLVGSSSGKFSGITCTGTKDTMVCNETLPGYTDAEEYFTTLYNNGSNDVGLIQTNGTELRYSGSNDVVKNYVIFNGEVPKVATVYQFYADGNVSTNHVNYGYWDLSTNSEGLEFPDEATCLDEKENFLYFSGYDNNNIPAKCVLNEETNKYYIEAHGFLPYDKTYKTQAECDNSLHTTSRNGGYLATEGTTISGLSCKPLQQVVDGWRLVGMFDVAKTDGGETEKRIKLVRQESLGEYSWDTTDRSINYGYGINQWGVSTYSNGDPYEGADLMRELNGDYLNTSLSSNTNWYNGPMNSLGNGNFDKKNVLKSSAQSLIDDAVWYLGRLSATETADQAYTKERSTSAISTPSDGVVRTNRWVGKVALIYASDYAYASSGCRNGSQPLGLYNDSTCRSTNWLKYNFGYATLSPTGSSIAEVSSVGSIDIGATSNRDDKMPSVYLVSGVKVKGTGTVSDPFIFMK